MKPVPLTSKQTAEIAEATGTSSLIVYCALTPCHEARALRVVSRDKVEEIKRMANALDIKEPA